MLKDLKNLSLPELEAKVLRFWKERGIFKKSLEARKAKGHKFVFYEGPPTANGRPGIHHVLARAFKDIIPRYKTMRGYFVSRRAGWDTHGLPVEIEVEKELGLKQKSEIEKFGIAEFNSRCRDLIWKYRSEWEALTERMGYWIDMSSPYITYENSYMESIWWILAQIQKRGLLTKQLRIVPWCSRCQTPLSSHELGQPGAYKLVKDPSVYVKFRIKGGRSKTPTYLLAWTTTPWTLVANLGLAVHPKLTYTKYLIKDLKTGESEYLWSYNPPPILPDKQAEVIEKISGRKLVGTKYEPLYSLKATSYKLKAKKLYEVYAGEFVSTEDGSGIVHVAPSFGEEDFNLFGLKEGLPITIDDRGHMQPGFPGAGKYIKTADAEILEDLASRRLIYYASTIEHEYPHCWRCSSPLIYMARVSWFIEMSKLRRQLLEENGKINWIPGHIKEGRFGEWLKEIKDWSISRNRYWGTPLPIWECQKCAKALVVGSLADLDKHAKNKNNFFAVRHGEATANVESRLASAPERESRISVLTEKGRAQSEALGQQLKKKKIDFIFVSPLKRTQQTARILAKATGARVLTDERLTEIRFGAFNGEVVGAYRASFARELDRFVDKPPGKSETLTEVRSRMLDFIREINQKYTGKNIVIVSHGDPIWMLHAGLNGLSNQQALDSGYFPKHDELKQIEAHNWPYDAEGMLNLHRPFIDTIELICPDCKKPTQRIKDILDVWFDSGAMPLASTGFPFKLTSDPELKPKEISALLSKLDFPADYIAEGIDQTRGWFYTLLAIGTLLNLGAPYKNVISVGLVLDKHGQKMSKSKGNIVLPEAMMEKYGADAVRWYFYSVNDPGDPKRFDEQDLAKVVRRFTLILYNSFVFWNAYGKRHETPKTTYEVENVLDKWVLAKLNLLIQAVTKKLDAYRIGEAARLIEEFADDLSRWYIRRSRDRFQTVARGASTDERDWEEASFTLQTTLLTLAKLLSPFMPFFAEAMYQSLGGSAESVHLEDWPEVNKDLIDAELVTAMAKARKAATDALALRAASKIKVRQPLLSVTLKDADLEDFPKVLELLQDEINVKKILFNPKLEAESGLALDTSLTVELKEEGIIRELIRTVQGLRQNAKYQMADEITLFIDAPDELSNLIQRHAIVLKRAVNAKNLELRKTDKTDANLETKVELWPVWLAVKKF